MTPQERLRIDGIVRDGLNVPPHRTVREVAEEYVRTGVLGYRREACLAILGRGEEWDRMAAAAAILEYAPLTSVLEATRTRGQGRPEGVWARPQDAWAAPLTNGEASSPTGRRPMTIDTKQLRALKAAIEGPFATAASEPKEEAVARAVFLEALEYSAEALLDAAERVEHLENEVLPYELSRAAAAERRVAELERAAEDRRQELESERAAKNHALATVRANLDAAERRVAELEAEAKLAKLESTPALRAIKQRDEEREAGRVRLTLMEGVAKTFRERAEMAEAARDEAVRRAEAAEGELGEVWRKLGRARGELAPGSDVLRSTAHDLRALDPETVATLDPKGVKP